MDQLRREHSRQLIGGALLIAALVVLLVGYFSIRDEIYVAIQMPYILLGGVGALMLTAIGIVVIRSQDDQAILDRVSEVESTNSELRERVDYLARLLEAALLPDESAELPGVATAAGARMEVR